MPADLPRTNHFGFRLPSGGEARAARERLRAAGVEKTEWQDDGRFVRVRVADPDGYRVELHAFESESIATMALEMRSSCERCGTALAAEGEATICSFECTFCADCAQAMDHVCPNCGGELVRRPRRSS